MNELHIEYRVGDADIAEALAVRRSVFIDDQHVPEELELDGLDGQAEHFIGYADDEAISTARVRFDDQGRAKIERVAVLSARQGQGYGRMLMRHILTDLEARGVTESYLESQVHALSFYESLGFSAVGEVFMDAGIPHKKMERKRQP